MKPTPREIGAANRAAVRALLATHLGISRCEIAGRLGLSLMAVSRHVAAIRAEWGAGPLSTKQNAIHGAAATGERPRRRAETP